MAKKPSLPVAKSVPAKAKPKATKPVPVTIVSDYPSTAKNGDYEARERKYRAEDALRTIKQANEYMADKRLMGDVKKLANEQVNCLKKIVK